MNGFHIDSIILKFLSLERTELVFFWEMPKHFLHIVVKYCKLHRLMMTAIFCSKGVEYTIFFLRPDSYVRYIMNQ